MGMGLQIQCSHGVFKYNVVMGHGYGEVFKYNVVMGMGLHEVFKYNVVMGMGLVWGCMRYSNTM